MSNINWRDDKVAAAQCAGNWKKNRWFSWWGRDDDPRNDEAVHYPLTNPGSDPLEMSNAQAIVNRLQKVDPRGLGWHVETFNVGRAWSTTRYSVTGDSLIIFPYRKNRTLTRAWMEFCEIQRQMENYSILDEDLYYRLEQEMIVDPEFEEIARLVNQLLYLEHDYIGDDFTSDQVRDTYDDLGLEYETDDSVRHYHRVQYDDHCEIERVYQEDVVRLISDRIAEEMLGISYDEKE